MQSTDQDLLFLILNTARHAKKLVLQQLDEQGKSLPFNLLANIDDRGNSLVELGQRLQCSKQEVTRLVQQAQQKHWIEVKPSEQDKRAKLVCLSNEGRSLLNQGLELYQSLERDLIGDWPEQEQQDFKQQLLQLNKNLKLQTQQDK